MTRSSLVRVLLLTAATAVWGSAFVVTKGTLTGMSAAGFLTWRFAIAAVVLALVGLSRIRAMSATDVSHGVLLGVFLSAGFLLQTTGLRDVSATLSGFLTGTMVVLTPLMAAVVFKERVGAAGWVAVLVAMCGIALLTLPGWAMGLGGVLTVGGAACFALHIAGLSRWATTANAYGLTALSVAFAAGLCACAAIVNGGPGALEPDFAAGLAAAVGGEQLSAVAIAGGLIVVVSMFIAELGSRRCCDAMSPRVDCC